MGPAGSTLGPCKVCFDIVWNCNADENMIIIQTFDARPWVHDKGSSWASSLSRPSEILGFPLGVLGQYMYVQAGPSRNLSQDAKSIESV